MTPILTIHLIAIGIWLGVVGAEFVIEFAGMKSQEARLRASRLHFLTDIWIEIPAFLFVLVTGLLMTETSHLGGAFLVKIVFGLLAIAFNTLCVFAVFRRYKYAQLQDKKGMDKVEPLMRLGGLVIPTFLVAFGLGLYFTFI